MLLPNVGLANMLGAMGNLMPPYSAMISAVANHHRLRRQHPVLQFFCHKSYYPYRQCRRDCASRTRPKHLSTLLVTLNLLSFLLHTVFDMMAAKCQLIRVKLPSCKMFFQHIQALTCYICFEIFNALLDFMLHGLKINIPDTG